MPVKWKIFLVLNFVLSLPALICFILMFINFINSSYARSDEEYLFVFLPLFSLLLISLNGLLNIYILQRFFPDKLLPAAVRRLNAVSLGFNILVAVGMLILCIYAASYEFGNENEVEDSAGKIALAILFFLWLVQIIVLVMQGQLPGLINRNHRDKMDSLIDSIGQ